MIKRYAIALALLLSLPHFTGTPTAFVQMSAPLSISTNKTHPPYRAFVEAEKLDEDPDWKYFEQKKQELREQAQALSAKPAAIMRLALMKVENEAPVAVESANTQTAGVAPQTLPLVEDAPIAEDIPNDISMIPSSEEGWVQRLPAEQRQRVQLAQMRMNGTSGSSLSAEPTIESTEASHPANTMTASEWVRRKFEAQKVADNTERSPSKSSWMDDMSALVDRGGSGSGSGMGAANFASNAEGEIEITGHLRIVGLQFEPNGRYIEVRRRHEGIDNELGDVNLSDASYRIRVKSTAGRVVARVKDRQDRTIAENSFYISQIRNVKGQMVGPELVISGGTDVASFKSLSGGLVKGMRAFVSNIEGETNGDGHADFHDIQPGSQVVFRATAKGHLISLALAPAGSAPNVALFTEGWARSLKEIVSEQNQMSLNNPDASIIWGKVVQDGRPIAGVSVEVESEPDLQPVYFNELLLPDSKLKATTSNGLYAFLGARSGFHALIARRGENYLAHHNTVVEDGSVSVTQIATQLRTESAPVRVYDALTGEPQFARVSHQAAEKTFDVAEQTTLTVPSINRISLVEAEPDAPYAKALYLANDRDGYVHIPLVRMDWLRALQAWSQIMNPALTSAVVGFSPDEDFVVENQGRRQKVIYFDREGKPTGQERGQAGGGFMILSEDIPVYELKVMNPETGMIAIRTFPLDSQTVVVVSLRQN